MPWTDEAFPCFRSHFGFDQVDALSTAVQMRLWPEPCCPTCEIESFKTLFENEEREKSEREPEACVTTSFRPIYTDVSSLKEWTCSTLERLRYHRHVRGHFRRSQISSASLQLPDIFSWLSGWMQNRRSIGGCMAWGKQGSHSNASSGCLTEISFQRSSALCTATESRMDKPYLTGLVDLVNFTEVGEVLKWRSPVRDHWRCHISA